MGEGTVAVTFCPTCGTVVGATFHGFETPHEKAEDCIKSLVRRVSALETRTAGQFTLFPVEPYRVEPTLGRMGEQPITGLTGGAGAPLKPTTT